MLAALDIPSNVKSECTCVGLLLRCSLTQISRCRGLQINKCVRGRAYHPSAEGLIPLSLARSVEQCSQKQRS